MWAVAKADEESAGAAALLYAHKMVCSSINRLDDLAAHLTGYLLTDMVSGDRFAL